MEHGGEVSDYLFTQEFLHSAAIILVRSERNLAEPVLVMASTRVKRPLRFLQVIREISDQFPPYVHFAISFSARQIAADVAV